MAMVCSAYGTAHRQLKRRTLALSVIDLIFIACTVGFVIVQMISISVTYPDLSTGSKSVLVSDNGSESMISSDVESDAEGEIEDDAEMMLKLQNENVDLHPNPVPDHDPNPDSVISKSKNAESTVTSADVLHNKTTNCNSTEDGCPDNEDDNVYKSVVGARISLSIQLIIYLTQLGFGVLLFIAAYHNDSRNLHLWVLFSEVIVVVICLNLFINFFGKFLWSVAIITAVYIVFKIFLIRLVRRFIHVNDLELTQFGSVGEFD